MQCDPNQLTGSDSSSGVAWEIDSFPFDRTSGRKIVIRYPHGIDIVLSGNAQLDDLSARKSSVALIKCLALLTFLSDLGSLSEDSSALEEAAEELEGIARFYHTRQLESTRSANLPPKIVRGKVTAVENKEPIALES